MISGFMDFIKGNSIYLAAFIVLTILILVLIFFIIMLIYETKKGKQMLNEQVNAEISNTVQNNVYKAQPLPDNQSTSLTHGTEMLSSVEPKPTPLAVISYAENGETKEYEIFNNSINIGRDPAVCDFPIPLNHYISRKHALLYSKDGNFFLTDLNSKNGTFVNWEKLQGEKQLYNNDIITLGTSEFKFNIK